MSVELVLAAAAAIGESPTWVPEEQALYWIDVKAPALHWLDPAVLATRHWPLPSDIGGFALDAARSRALVALRSGLFWLDLRSGGLTGIAPPPFDPALHRFNESACDTRGRFWIGTMFDPLDPRAKVPEPAGLFTYTTAEGLRRAPDEAQLHNGMAWSPDERLFYLAHSNSHMVQVFAYDSDGGRLSNRRAFVATPPALGVPDGAAVDVDGGYWCALHGGGRLRRYRPDGTLDREILLPVSQPTMCAFGGPKLETLYITSAANGLSAEAHAKEPFAGGVFRTRPGAVGIPRPYAVA
jgi:sugar lactone lactonase YvrE